MLLRVHNLLRRMIRSLSMGLLFLFAVAVPHSIAVAQGSALALALLWLLDYFLRPPDTQALPPEAEQTADVWLPLSVFFTLCTVSALGSYEPRVSLDGLRSVAFMGSCGVVARWVATQAQAWRLACVVLASAQIGLLYTGYQLVVGVGVRLVELAPDSPLRPYFQPGDVLLQVDGHSLHTPEEIAQMLGRHTAPADQPVLFTGRRVELPLRVELDRRALRQRLESAGTSGLGIQASEPARDFRASGFFSHYVTYAEVLQILISLAIGMAWRAPRAARRWLWAASGLLLLALWLTLSRGPTGSLVVSLCVMLYLLWREGTLRTQRMVVSVVLAGMLFSGVLAYAYAMRRMAVTDAREGSLFWRLVVWHEGVRLVSAHPWFGVGRQSDKLHAAEWGLYAAGDLPPGHFHNTYLQIAVWYGLPALAAYFWLLLTYFGRLLERVGNGVALGAIGALAGFAIGGIAHFNLGDGEVAMALWFVLGLALGPRSAPTRDSSLGLPP